MLPFFTKYVSLGYSLSIDLYPALDVGETDVAVALERDPEAGSVAPIGAASLFYQNDDARWPDEQGDDLASRYPGIGFQNFADDMATIGDVFGAQLAVMEESEEPTLISLSIGGNDLLSAFSNKPRATLLERIASDLWEAYEFMAGAIQRARPNSLILLTTLCDPSDGTGRIPGVLEDVGVLPLDVLNSFNADIRSLAASMPGTALADVHAHFLGHGASVLPEDRWYWRRSLVEPNAIGANEIRRVWRSALDAADADA